MDSKEEKFNVLTCYYRPKPGGYCKRLFRAINALLQRGHTVHYLAVVPFPISHPNCNFHRFPWPQNYTSGYLFWAFFHFFSPLQLIFIGFRYKVNRMFAFGHNYALFLQPLRILKRIPLALFLRADSIENHRISGHSSWLIRLESLLEGLGIAGTRLYGVSETLTRNVIQRHKFLQPVTHGLLRNDIAKPSPKLDKIRNVELPLRLGCVGILERRKNQRFLLEVMKEVGEDKAQLYLYGVGPDEKFLKKTVEAEKLADRVHFMGWKAAEDIWPEIDLLLMPSLHEGAPNAVLEALANYVPLLASDIAEHAEILPSEDLLSINQAKEWIRLLNSDSSLLINKLEKIAKRQSFSGNKLIFNWERAVVQIITKDEY